MISLPPLSRLSPRLLRQLWLPVSTPCASNTNKPVPNLKPPRKYPEFEYPEKRKLTMVAKIPNELQHFKMPRRLSDIRGPEETNTFLHHRMYGIRALQGGHLRYGHFEMMRYGVNRKMDEKRMFAIWRVDPPWKPITKKGQGQRMGSGKAAIDHYVTPVKAGRIILELAGECEYHEVYPFLRVIAHNLPFRADVVSQEILDAQKVEEEEAVTRNLNPFTFKYCIENNMFGIRKWASPYDYKWHNKYR